MLPEVKASYGKLRNLINGEWVEPDASGWLDVENPVTTGVIAQVPLFTPSEVTTRSPLRRRRSSPGARPRPCCAPAASSRSKG